MGLEMPDVAGVEHRYVTVRGIRVHLAEAGPADAPPVLLLHGFPQHWYVWRRVLPLLAESHRVVAMDLRGFGWSDAPRRGYSGPELAADVLAVLDELGVRTGARIVGHDWGAWVGFIVALTAPERVGGLVAVNMTHPWPRPRDMVPNLWRMWHTALLEYPPLGRFVLRRWPGFAAGLIRHWSRTDAGAEAAGHFAEVLREPARARAGEQFHWRYVVEEIFGHPRGRFRKARLTVPALVVAGERDVVVPARVVTHGAAGHADALRVVVVPDGGHLLPEEMPEAVARETLEFFSAEVPAGRRAAG